jgi:Fe-S cluster assembly protein SufD
MSIAISKFTPPKSEAWKFSGLKELDLRGLDLLSGTGPARHTFLGELPEEVVHIVGEQIMVDRLPLEADLVATCKRLVVGEGSVLHYALLNISSASARVFDFLTVEAGRNAKVTLTLINLGASYTRQEITAVMKDPGADVRLRSLTVADANCEIDQRTLQIHEAPDTKSDLLFKNVLSGSARTIFSGMIRVCPGAQRTDAYQKNRNLILSDSAQANSLPGLEIQADDVRCTHGATCGKLDSDELFYLRSRGIAEPDAKRILVGGFCEEILESLPKDVVEEVRKKLGTER